MRRLARPLLYLGTIGAVLGLGRVHAQFIGHYVFHTSDRLPWALAYAGFLCVAAYGVGLPELARSRRSALGAAVAAAAAGAAAISVVQLGLGSLLLPRFVVGSAVVLLVPWYVACNALANAGRSREEERDRVAVVAGPEDAEALRADLAVAPEKPASVVVAMVPDEAHPAGPRSRPLVEAVVANRASVVVLGREAQSEDAIVAQAASLHEYGIRVRTLSLFYEEWLGKLPLGELERVSLMFDIGELHRNHYARVKRLADVVVGLVGGALLVPVIVLVALGNLVANRGPVFYRQARVGRGGRTFVIVKFRTMRSGTEGTEWTSAGDARVTPFGRWLRRSHVDELPQVLNILRGDLSIVGPRPEQPGYVAELRQKIAFYDYRLRVQPGLTGWAQVNYRYGSSDFDAMEKLQYDFYYLRHQGLSLDLRIVGRTLRSVARHTGR